MKLYFPPLAQFLVFGLLGCIAAWLLPELDFALGAAPFVALLILVAGLTLLYLAVRSFRTAATTVNPIEPDQATELVTDGLYGFTRNPMYLGMLLVLLGGAVFVQNYAALIGPVLFVASITALQIKPEERVLREKFGADYEHYAQNTRRWI